LIAVIDGRAFLRAHRCAPAVRTAGSRRLLGTLCAVLALGATGALVAVPAASAGVRSCPRRADQPTIGQILSVRNMTCSGAYAYYRRHHGDQHVPISKGQVTHIGRFACHVYQDLTPPGPSDTWVRIRCVHGSKAFRLEYGV
jgi:hypothetical protein